jgi:hypothetical protein
MQTPPHITGSSKDEEPKNLELFGEEDVISLDEVAFDEMNIIEMPIALLTRDTKGKYEIPLSKDGQTRLACMNSSEFGLPNSLAPRVILGLMWLWKREGRAESQTFSFKVRDLVTNYMFPDRFANYPPNGELLRSAERQLNCVANSRIHTNRWWDKDHAQHQKANIALIDSVLVIDEGGRNKARVLEVTWGKAFWKSMVSQYTKSIDARLVQSLEKPLDLQLYRLLDRQLNIKPVQRYTNIIHLARFKLGMTGQKLDAGGRTASSYITKQLRSSLKRLSCEGFSVRMTIDKSSDVFAVTFERIDGVENANEVKEEDFAGEVLREFFYHAHEIPRDAKRTRISKADRDAAEEWVKAYGVEKAKWMVAYCVTLQKDQRRQPIQLFAGLQFYESSASGAYERFQLERAGQLQLAWNARINDLWHRYNLSLIERFDAEASESELSSLEKEAEKSVHEQRETSRPPNKLFIKPLIISKVQTMKCERMNCMPEEAFKTFQKLSELREALIKHHGFDPIPAEKN